MRRAKRSTAGGAGERSQLGEVGSTGLAELGARFARFRLEHRRGARYPEELKQGALRLLEEVAPDDLYRTCGLSFRQVMTWKGAQDLPPAGAIAAEREKVRAFSVVDDERVHLQRQLVVRGAEAQFELRMGPWSVTVCARLAGGGQARRGRA